MDSFNLKNNVSFPAHAAEHTLDLILSDQSSAIIDNVVQGHFISDHCFIN